MQSMHHMQSMTSIGGAVFNPNNVKAFVEDNKENKLVIQRIEGHRPKPRIIYKNTESSDEDENEQFQATPSEDVPKNKLVDKLVRGLQSYI